MLKETDAFLKAKPTYVVALLSLSLVAVIGVIDETTGHELSFSIFYTIPIGVGTWYVGRRFGYFVSVTAAITWMAADYIAGHEYSYAGTILWNTVVRLGYFVIIASLLDYVRGFVDAQEILVQKDGLTGLLNARTFKDRCNTIFALASRHRRPLALGYLDLDGFKTVNDNFGHGVGDQVLKAVASTLSHRLRASDMGCRLGGDEFAVLLPETDIAGARTFFTSLHDDVIKLAAANHWPIGVSIGVATYQRPAANSEAALGFADGLMYRVKKSGKNHILFEEPPGEMPATAMHS